MKKYLIVGVIGILFLFGVYLMFFNKLSIPREKPTVTLKYNGENVETSIGENTWLPKGQLGGNSYLAGWAYDLGNETKATSAKINDEIEIDFSFSPKEMRVNLWTVGNEKDVCKMNFESNTKYSIRLPEERGEYIYEVVGYWSERNNTSTVFKVKVE